MESHATYYEDETGARVTETCVTIGDSTYSTASITSVTTEVENPRRGKLIAVAVMALAFTQRTREIGIRMAMGAERGAVLRLILKEAGWLAALGISAGLGCAVAAATLMRSLLFGVQAWDAPTPMAVTAVLGVSALVASFLPASRAAGVNPVEALKTE